MTLDTTSIIFGALGGIFALAVLAVWCYFCYYGCGICLKYRKEKKGLKKSMPKQPSSRQLSRQATETPSAPPLDFVTAKSCEQQNPTARSHFKKTLLCDIARSPSSQSTQSQGVGGQLNTIDRSDSFSHVDFSLFDVQEDVEDDVANPMRYSSVTRSNNRHEPPPLYSDLYLHATVVDETTRPPSRLHKSRADTKECSQLRTWPQLY
ncbi:hypothetical protein EMCRGX_G014797 [Ephydatia muelleri]|eukprot:Em0005g1201a